MIELSCDLFTLSLCIAKDLKPVSEQPLFKVLIGFVWYIEDTRETFFLNMDEHSEQDEDFREVKSECIPEALPINLLDSKRVLVEEILVIQLLLR